MFRLTVITCCVFVDPHTGERDRMKLSSLSHVIEACSITLLKEEAEKIRVDREQHLKMFGHEVIMELSILPKTLECVRKADPGEIDLLNDTFEVEQT